MHNFAHVCANLAYAVQEVPAHFVVKQLSQVRDGCDGQRRLREMSGEQRW